MDTELFKELESNLKEAVTIIKEGRCRFNCRTAKDNWIEGWLDATAADSSYYQVATKDMNKLAEEAYREWKRRQRTE